MDGAGKLNQAGFWPEKIYSMRLELGIKSYQHMVKATREPLLPFLMGTLRSPDEDCHCKPLPRQKMLSMGGKLPFPLLVLVIETPQEEFPLHSSITPLIFLQNR